MIQHDTVYQEVSGNNVWYKLGVWNTSGQGANLKLTLLGGSGYNTSDNNKSGETIIYAKILNNLNTSVANIGGMFHSVGNPTVYQVKFKQVSSNRYQYEVHAEVPSYTLHNMSIECSLTTSFTRYFAASGDPGVDSPTVRAAKLTHAINESGNLTVGGRVGIGESSPAELVHIRGTGPHMLIEGASNGNGQIDFSSGPSYRNSRHQIESRHYALSGNGYRNWLAFRVNEGGQSTPSTRMVIRGDGRVGIGTGHTDAVGTVDIDPSAGRSFAGNQTGPGHTPPLYITGNLSPDSNGIEFRHSNQSQGIGFGYNTIYATGGTGTSADQDLSLKAYNNGTVRLNGGTAISSDDRLKTNEEYITNATETLLKLKPQVYDKHKKINETCENPVREAGLITQDVYYDAPELRFLVHARNEGMDAIIPVNIPEEKPFVDEDPTKDPDYSGWGTDTASLNYEGFIPYLIKTIQELHERIDALENA